MATCRTCNQFVEDNEHAYMDEEFNLHHPECIPFNIYGVQQWDDVKYFISNDEETDSLTSIGE